MKYKKHRKKLHLKTVLLWGVLSVIGALVTYNTRDLLFGSPFSIATAADGSTVNSDFLPVSGSASHARDIRINGRSVSLDRKGNFSDGVILSPGYNVVEVALKDQFGKEKTKIYHLVVREAESVATAQLPSYKQ